MYAEGDSRLPSATLPRAPRESCVTFICSSKEEAGRHATARRSVSPGELVLSAAPYVLVMNPSYCPSALYLSSRASWGMPGVATRASHAARGGQASPKRAGAHGGRSQAKGSPLAAAAGVSGFASHYTHALHGEDDLNESNSLTTAPRWRTTMPAWCSVCFQEIPAGRWLCNRGSLAELAMDITLEQDELDRVLSAAEERAACPGSTHSDGRVVDFAATMDDAMLRTPKKPLKSNNTRKGSAVELRTRLLEKALGLREELLYQRKIQRSRRVEQGLPAVRREGWEALMSSSPDAAAARCGEAAMSGCTGCGVLCYCSEACWRAYRDAHERGGECAILRSLYPRLMAEYYTMGAASSSANAGPQGRGGGASTSVVMPGDEQLSWARSTSEPRMLEFQALLCNAIVIARAHQAGYQAHFTPVAENAALSWEGNAMTCAGAAQVVGDGSDSVEVEAEARASGVCSLPSTAEGAVLDGTEEVSLRPQMEGSTVTARDSVVVPKEVWLINEIRAKAGLTGTVEVLDPDPELRRIANAASSLKDSLGNYTGDEASSDADAGDEGKASALNVLLTRTHSSEKASSGSGLEDGPPVHISERTPPYAQLAQLETNFSVLSKQHRSIYQRYYRAFVKRVLPVLQHLLHKRNTTASCCDVAGGVSTASQSSGSHDEDAGDVLQVSELYFQRLCAAAQCNSFGVYDTENHCIGFGVYPEASYFNHSCAPNLCRVMHHGGRTATFYALRAIAPDEPLTICYTDVEQQNTAERRRHLLGTYRFFCMCERCSGKAEGPQMAIAAAGNRGGEGEGERGVVGPRSGCTRVSSTLFEKSLLLCTECAIRGYLRPLPPDSSCTLSSSVSSSSWSMQQVEVRQCTVCRSLVVRDAQLAVSTDQ